MSSQPEPASADDTEKMAHADEQLRQLRKIRHLLVFLALLGGALACYFAKDVLLPIILGVMLALTLSPIVRTVHRIGVPPVVSGVILVLIMGAGLGGGGYAASGPVGDLLGELPEIGTQLREKLSGVSEQVERVQKASEEVEEMAERTGSNSVQRVAIEQPGILNTAVSNAAQIGTTFVVSLVLALFLLASGDMFRAKLVEVMPRLSDKKRAIKIMSGVERAISRYLLTITIINAGLGLAVWGLMALAGLPKPYVWGLIAFVFNFLPYVGAAAGIILVAMFSVLTFDTMGQAVIAPLLYLVATSIEGQLVTPAILGRSLQLNTVSVFVTVVFWGWLWGIPGALMAVPFLVIVKVVADNIDSLATLGHFLGGANMKVQVDGPEDVPKSAA